LTAELGVLPFFDLLFDLDFDDLLLLLELPELLRDDFERFDFDRDLVRERLGRRASRR